MSVEDRLRDLHRICRRVTLNRTRDGYCVRFQTGLDSYECWGSSAAVAIENAHLKARAVKGTATP